MFRTFVEIILSTITRFCAFSSTIVLFTSVANTTTNQRISYVVATKLAMFSITPKLITNPLLRQHTSNGCSPEVTADETGRNTMQQMERAYKKHQTKIQDGNMNIRDLRARTSLHLNSQGEKTLQ